MLHVTCDLCGKKIRPGEDHHFVVKIEVFAAHDPAEITEADLDEDHMEAVGQLLRDMEEGMETRRADDPAQEIPLRPVSDLPEEIRPRPARQRIRPEIRLQRELTAARRATTGRGRRELPSAPPSWLAVPYHRQRLRLVRIACSMPMSRPRGIQLDSKTVGSMTVNCRSTVM